jgi:hypothetical protein
MRKLAQVALEAHGLGEAPYKFYLYAGNTLYRVYDLNPELAQSNDALFEPSQYLLRIYQNPRLQIYFQRSHHELRSPRRTKMLIQAMLKGGLQCRVVAP